MPITKFKRGDIWHLRGTVKVGDRTQSYYRSSGLSDEGQAEIHRAQVEAGLIAELLHGKEHVASFREAMVSYGKSGGSNRFLAKVDDAFGNRKLKTIGQAELDSAARRAYPKAAPATLNRQFYTPFITVWNHAVLNGWAQPRKWQRARQPKGTNVRALTPRRSGTHPVSYDRAAMFVAAMSPAPAMLMTTFFYTGMRPIEVLTLEAEDVDIDGRWITLPTSKTGEPRGVPIHEFLVPLFTSLVERGGVLFRTYKGKPYEPKDDNSGGQMQSSIMGARRRLRRAGTPIDDVSPYTGRHSVSTQLVINAVHPHIKDQILGHAVDSMSRRYTSVPQAPLIEAINTLPVPAQWKALPWWENPVKWVRRSVDGQGRRTDLEKRKSQSAQ